MPEHHLVQVRVGTKEPSLCELRFAPGQRARSNKKGEGSSGVEIVSRPSPIDEGGPRSPHRQMPGGGQLNKVSEEVGRLLWLVPYLHGIPAAHPRSWALWWSRTNLTPLAVTSLSSSAEHRTRRAQSRGEAHQDALAKLEELELNRDERRHIYAASTRTGLRAVAGRKPFLSDGT